MAFKELRVFRTVNAYALGDALGSGPWRLLALAFGLQAGMMDRGHLRVSG